MMSDAEDEGLSWGGDESPPVVQPSGAPAAGGDDQEGTAPRTSSALLIAYGIVAGVTLLYVIGWIIAVRRDTYSQAGLFAEVMYQLGEFLAIASPVIWMGGVLLLTRGSRPVLRVAWMVAGLLLLAPWPFILGG